MRRRAVTGPMPGARSSARVASSGSTGAVRSFLFIHGSVEQESGAIGTGGTSAVDPGRTRALGSGLDRHGGGLGLGDRFGGIEQQSDEDADAVWN